jgi:MYXO-CTERM domain-containing protein
MWSIYQTGLLCLRINSSDVHKLSGGSFPLNAGIFSLLAPNLTKLVPQDAPVQIELQPTQAPRVQFGTGQQVGGQTDSTLQLYIPDMGISLSVMLHDRFVRLFRLVVDMNLGLSIMTTPNNALEATFDTDQLKLQNARTEQANLVDAADINSLLPTLLTLITQVLGNSKISFPIDISDSISKALGVPIMIDINGINRDGVGQDWLTLALTMRYASGMPLMPRPQTVAQLDTQNPGWLKTVNGKLQPTGEVRLLVPQYLGSNELEYQYFVNYGAWSSFQSAPNGVLTVRNRVLNLLGQHTVYLRARLKGHYRTLEEDPVKVSFTFDPVPPSVNVTQKDGFLMIRGVDQVSPQDQIRTEAKINGSWQEIQGAIPLASLRSPNVDIRVRDAHGNTRQVAWSTEKQAMTEEKISNNPNATPSNSPKMGFGCNLSDNASSTAPLWMLLLLLLPFLRRRR